MLFTRIGMTKSYQSERFTNSVKTQHLCQASAKAKITRRFFSAKPVKELQGNNFLEKVTLYISLYLNCPSQQGFKYVLLLTDITTKII